MIPPSDQAFAVRAMAPSDLGAVSALAAEIHPSYPEEDAVLAEKLAFFPDGCLLLEMDGRPAGYLLSHPWRRFSPPALNRPLGSLPAAPDAYYIHDLALLPLARGSGAAGWMVAAVLDVARSLGFTWAALVAVSGSAPFWRSQGFASVPRSEIAGRLDSYGSGSTYMELKLGPRPA